MRCVRPRHASSLLLLRFFLPSKYCKTISSEKVVELWLNANKITVYHTIEVEAILRTTEDIVAMVEKMTMGVTLIEVVFIRIGLRSTPKSRKGWIGAYALVSSATYTSLGRPETLLKVIDSD